MKQTKKPARGITLQRMMDEGWPLEKIVDRVRVTTVLRALEHEQGHHSKAAARLGIHRNTVTRVLAGTELEKKYRPRRVEAAERESVA